MNWSNPNEDVIGDYTAILTAINDNGYRLTKWELDACINAYPRMIYTFGRDHDFRKFEQAGGTLPLVGEERAAYWKKLLGDK